jgi:hypothetical protein
MKMTFTTTFTMTIVVIALGGLGRLQLRHPRAVSADRARRWRMREEPEIRLALF